MKLIKIATIGMIAVGSLSISSSSLAEMENVTKNEAQAAPSSFPHVPGWVKPSVDYLINKNVLSGMPDGTFSPNLEIDRGSAAKMMAKILNLPVDQSAAPTFDDSKKHWAAPVLRL